MRNEKAVSSYRCPVFSPEMNWFSVLGDQCSSCSKEQGVLAGQTQNQIQRKLSKQLTKKWPEIKQEMEIFSKHLSKTYLVKAITILSEARKSRFLRRRTPKYGSMNKAFTDEELQRFFGVIDDPKFSLLFHFQAIMGLRIGEAVRVNIKDLNLRTRELRIFTEKSNRTDYLLIPLVLFDRQ